jgi:hypothetical protein
MKFWLKFVGPLLLLLLTLSPNNFAEMRNYVWTYGAQTTPSKILGIEYSLSNIKADTENIAITTWQPQIGFQYGLTASLDVGMFHVFQQAQDTLNQNLSYYLWKLRARLVFSDSQSWPFDCMISADYQRPADWRLPSASELRLAFSKTLDSLNLAYNQIYQTDLLQDAPGEHSFAVGVGYWIFPFLSLGVEAQGSYSTSTLALGPSLSLADKINSLFFTWGVIYGMNNRSRDVESRMVFGVSF